MKKLIALLTVSVAAIAIAAADPIIVGHGFVNLNALGTTFENAPDGASTFGAFGSNIGAGGGVGVNIPFGGYFGVQPEIDFFANRVGYKYESSGVEYVSAASYLSLDIPVLFTAKIEKWNFKVGPYVSIPLGDLKPTVKINGSSTTYSGNDITSNAVFGLLLGAGYEERLGMGRIIFGANYMLDFTPITINNALGNPVKQFTRRGLMIDIGYKVPLTF